MRKSVILLIIFAPAAACRQDIDQPSAKSEATPQQSAVAGETQLATESDSSGEPDNSTSEFDEMVSVLKLADEERTQLRSAFEERDKIVGHWLAEKGDELKRLEREMLEAAKSRDLPGVQRLTAQAAPLRNELRELIKAQQENIRKVLSKEHQRQWEAHELAEEFLELIDPLNPTEDQINQIRAQAGRFLDVSSGEPNPVAAAYLKMEKWLETDVLTADQRQAFEKIKQRRPLRSLKKQPSSSR